MKGDSRAPARKAIFECRVKVLFRVVFPDRPMPKMKTGVSKALDQEACRIQFIATVRLWVWDRLDPNAVLLRRWPDPPKNRKNNPRRRYRTSDGCPESR